jgi:hypothetical protein
MSIPISLQGRLIEKLQGTIGLTDARLTGLLLLDEVMKILPDFWIPQFIWGSMKVKGKAPDPG